MEDDDGASVVLATLHGKCAAIGLYAALTELPPGVIASAAGVETPAALRNVIQSVLRPAVLRMS